MSASKSKSGTSINPEVEAYVESVKEKAEDLVKRQLPVNIVRLNALLESPDFACANPASVYQPLNVPIPDGEAVLRAMATSPSGGGGNNHVQNDTSNDQSTGGRGRKRARPNDVVEDPDPKAGNNTVPPVPEKKGFSGTDVLALPTGLVLSNSKIERLIEIVKPELRQLVEDSNLLKIWVTFLIPKIEDGNNFGVSIQEDTLGEIRTVEAEASAFYEQISRYFLTRGKIVSKVAKYPHIQDYRKVIAELDEKEHLSLRVVLAEVRNHYACLYDLITKNMEKIVTPRSSNSQNLY